YSRAAAMAARAFRVDAANVPAFFDGSLPPPPRDETRQPTVTLDELGRFLAHPVKFLLRERLGLRLDDWSETMVDREPVELDHLQQYLLREKLLDAVAEGRPTGDLLAAELAAGGMVPGLPGERIFQGLLGEARAFAAALQNKQQGDALPPLVVDLDVAGVRVVGTVGDLWTEGRIQGRYAGLRLKDIMRAWVSHLLICAAGPGSPEHPGLTCRTTLLSKGSKGRLAQCSLGSVAAPTDRLAELVSLWKIGQQSPVRLFPQGAMAWLDRVWHPGRTPADQVRQKALDKARGGWNSTKYAMGDDQDPWLNQLFATVDDAYQGGEELAFANLADRVLAPIAVATGD
ncbi:MAG: hypothetical protein GXP62_12320, partial [Oligoflexia bacterium]|nr:hypothetical protein [Oligoflexia bacterium]